MRVSLVCPSAMLTVISLLPSLSASAPQNAVPATVEGDFVIKNFKFRSGESLENVHLHYTTLGKPVRNAQSLVSNAVLLLHGTGGSGSQFLQPIFAGELFGPGQLLDVTQFYVILPDGLGHGKSSKPSEGLHSRFPNYDYDDMVAAQYQLLTEGLGVNHLRLILGTSMGCMHSFVWGETYPDFMDALMPLACQPVQIAGRNRLWRKMVMDAIRNDPEWKGGDYTAEPQQALRTALDLLLIAGSAPLPMQKAMPTRDAADQYLDDYFKTRLAPLDANDLLHQVNASRNYDPSPQLEEITVPVMFVNSADDFINPPELGNAERQTKRVKNARFVLIPINDETRGHGTHTRAVVWKQYLAELLDKSAH
jgi:homoserine O-acetyltransferase/O-succinyltransferase